MRGMGVWGGGVLALLVFAGVGCEEERAAGDSSHGDAALTDAVDAADTADTADTFDPGYWPGYGKATCDTIGWTWIEDVATWYCPPGEYCGPATYSCYCVLPCTRDADCAGTTVPVCGMIPLNESTDVGACRENRRFCVPAGGFLNPPCFNAPSASCPPHR